MAPLVELRNVYAPADVRAGGFEYASVGRAQTRCICEIR